jgi:hypothetical protein
MRCFFLRDGHIAAVELLPQGLDDAEAVERSRQMFEERTRESRYEGFEVWDMARVVAQFLPPQVSESGRSQF